MSLIGWAASSWNVGSRSFEAYLEELIEEKGKRPYERIF